MLLVSNILSVNYTIQFFGHGLQYVNSILHSRIYVIKAKGGFIHFDVVLRAAHQIFLHFLESFHSILMQYDQWCVMIDFCKLLTNIMNV